MEYLHQLFLQELGAKVLNVKDSSKGVDQEVKRVTTDKGIFFYKKPLKEQIKITNEIQGTKAAETQGIPAPKVIFSNGHELIETAIPGEIISEVKLSKEERLILFRKIGHYLRKLHEVTTQGFGPIISAGQGKYTTQKEFIHSWLDQDLKELEEHQHFSSEEIVAIKNYFTEHETFLETTQSVLLHADATDYNVLINEGEISGFVDFGDLLTGPPAVDFATWRSEANDRDEVYAMIEGHGAVNPKEVDYYGAGWLVWMINSQLKKGKRKETQLYSKRLLDIIHN